MSKNSQATPLFFFITLLSLSLAIHTSERTHFQTSELDALKAQQGQFQAQVKGIVQNLSTIESNLNQTTNNSQKVIILENAIISERQQVFNLSNSIIPPFNLSQSACQQMTNDQKISMLDQIAQAKQQINGLKNLSNTLPTCTEVSQIQADITKQQFLLNSIQKILYTQCNGSVVLSPTIFQSNVYAPNWILGNQTIDDLIQEYYQRSIQYHNVTNCPDIAPFFDGTKCVNCNDPTPIFNMQTKQCTACPADTSLNTSLRTCMKMPHYTDYTSTNNWALDGAPSLPPVDPTLTPCPKNKPYYNGTDCTTCVYQYWSVQTNTCKNCTQGQIFEPNTQVCVTPIGPMLTQLQNTSWISPTQNISAVLAQRAQILASNPNATYCPNNAPYYTGVACIDCPYEFNISSLACTTAPNNSVAYDDNLHTYATIVNNTESNALASNYLMANAPIVNTSTPDCPIATPYYDGVSCIQCPSPFTLFNVDTLTCTQCSPLTTYNATTKKCDSRPVVYVSNLTSNLIATKNTTVPAYFNQMTANITNSTIVLPCDPNQNSNYTTCLTCTPPTQYFNVETKQCVGCNGTYIPANNSCAPLAVYLTNLSANVIVPANKTLQDYQNLQNNISATSPTVICPTSTPYAVDNSTCIPCNAPNLYFNLSSKTCVPCPDKTNYNPKTDRCQSIQLVTNVPSATNYIEQDNGTMANLQSNITALNQTTPVTPCPAATPYYNRANCINCSAPSPYFNLATSQCVACASTSTYDPVNHVCGPPVIYYANLTNSNWTVNNASDVQTLLSNTTALKAQPKSQECPAGQEFYNSSSTTCTNCSLGLYYNYDSNVCVSCNAPQVIDANTRKCCTPTQGQYQTNLNSPNLAYGGISYNQHMDDYNTNVSTYPGIQDCTSPTPYFDGCECISCPSSLPYFNLATQLCQTCPSPSVYDSTIHECMSNGNIINTSPNPAKMYSTIF